MEEEKTFCRVCNSARHVEEWRLKNGEPVYLCIDCWQRGYLKGMLVERVTHNPVYTVCANARATKRNVGAKDVNGKEICIGDKVKMHDFFVGTVGVNVWGTYTKKDNGRLLYWSNYIDDPEKEIEVIGR